MVGPDGFAQGSHEVGEQGLPFATAHCHRRSDHGIPAAIAGQNLGYFCLSAVELALSDYVPDGPRVMLPGAAKSGWTSRETWLA